MAEAPSFASPPDLPPPFGYSHVVTISAGRQVWTSGQVGMTVDGRLVDGWEAQTRLAFENVGRALAAGGAQWNDVIKLTFYVTATDELGSLRTIRDEFVNTQSPPTSTLVQVAGLFRPEALIEIEAIAQLP